MMMTSFLLKISVVVFAVVAFASAVKFEFPKKDPCEIASFSASFDIVDKDTKEKAIFKVDDTMEVSGSCNASKRELVLTSKNTSVVFTFGFTKPDNKTLPVKLTMQLDFIPSKLFKNNTDKAKKFFSHGPMPLATASKSWKCMETLEEQFTGPSNFIVKSNISDLYIQAFGVTNGTFSKAEECFANKTTTSTPKTTHTTPKTTHTTPKTTHTTPKTTHTTPKTTPTTPKTTPSTPPTTTPLPERPIRLELKDGNKTCIILDGVIQIQVLYAKKDNKTVLSKPLFLPANTSVSGKCPTNNQAEMVLEFEGQKITLQFSDSKKEQVTMDKVSMKIKPSGPAFPNSTSPNTTMNFAGKGILESFSDKTFYYCNDDDVQKFKEDNKTSLTLKIKELQVFNINNNNVTGDGSLCKRDRPSTSTQTPTTTPKPIPAPTQNNFTVRGENETVCIYMQAAFQISVTYLNNKKKNVTKLINIPAIDSAHMSGTCNKTDYWTTAQELDITFFKPDWTMHMVFAKPSSSSMLTASSSQFSLDEITLYLNLNNKQFPDIGKTSNLTVHARNLTTFSAKQAYKCNSNMTIFKNNEQVSLFSSNLMYKAFGTTNQTGFGNDVTECSNDEETNSTVPIAVGAALAGLVVIVLIAYLIGRRRSRRSGYESV